MFVSTHLIAEFEGLIDEFTIIEDGRAVLSVFVAALQPARASAALA